MRLIDADALPRHGNRGGLVHWKDIVDAPTIDAVSINDYRSMENTCYKLQKALYELADRKTENCLEDISQEDFGTLCICALRYCHGRRTYMPSLVQSIVVRHFKDLSDRDLKVIADDEKYQSDMNLFGDMCDKVDWKNFYQILREWRTERSE